MSNVLRLTILGDEYFPVTLSDAILLSDHGVRGLRIPQRSIGLLRRTLLQGVPILTVPWREVREGITSQVLAALKKSKVDYKIINKMSFAVKSLPKDFSYVESTLARLRVYFLRYGVSARISRLERGNFTYAKVTLVSDPTLDVSLGFAGELSKPKTDSVEVLNFSSRSRMKIETAKSQLSKDKLAISITVEDLVGDNSWEEVFRRTFDLESVDRKSVERFASGLIGFI